MIEFFVLCLYTLVYGLVALWMLSDTNSPMALIYAFVWPISLPYFIWSKK